MIEEVKDAERMFYVALTPGRTYRATASCDASIPDIVLEFMEDYLDEHIVRLVTGKEMIRLMTAE